MVCARTLHEGDHEHGTDDEGQLVLLRGGYDDTVTEGLRTIVCT